MVGFPNTIWLAKGWHVVSDGESEREARGATKVALDTERPN